MEMQNVAEKNKRSGRSTRNPRRRMSSHEIRERANGRSLTGPKGKNQKGMLRVTKGEE